MSEPEKKGSETKERNVCCHYCRISQNRKRKKYVPYLNCRFCSNVFCYNCVVNHLGLDFEKTKNDPNFKCLPCKEECCCCKNECLLDHRHCFTSIRTKKRYAKMRELKMKQLQLRRRRQQLNDDYDYIDENEPVDESVFDNQISSSNRSPPAPQSPVLKPTNQEQNYFELPSTNRNYSDTFRSIQTSRNFSSLGFGPGFIPNSSFNTNLNFSHTPSLCNTFPGVLVDAQSLVARMPLPNVNFSSSPQQIQGFVPYKKRLSSELPSLLEDPVLKRRNTLFQSSNSPTSSSERTFEKESVQSKTSNFVGENCPILGQTSAFTPCSNFVKRPIVPIIYHNEKLIRCNNNSSPSPPPTSVSSPNELGSIPIDSFSEKSENSQPPKLNQLLPPLSQALSSTPSPQTLPPSPSPNAFKVYQDPLRSDTTPSPASSLTLPVLPPLTTTTAPPPQMSSSPSYDPTIFVMPPTGSQFLYPVASQPLSPLQTNTKLTNQRVIYTRDTPGALQIPSSLRLPPDHIVMKTMVSAN